MEICFMKNRLLFLLLSLVLVCAALSHAQDKDDDDDDDQMRPTPPRVMNPALQPAGATFACPYLRNYQTPQKFGAYTLRLLPTVKPKKDKDDKDKDDDDDAQYHEGDARCRAVLSRPGHRKITIAYEWALSIDPISGTDLNGDGKPEIVLSGYTGGLRCCYAYEVVSLDGKPKVLHTFQNPIPMKFDKQSDGTVLIRATDGVFDFFMVPHMDAVLPQLVLKPEGNNLVDVSAKYPEIYDKEIEQTRKQLTPAELEKFRNSNYHDKLYTDQFPTVRKVLTIVLDYIYSGREELAWQTLDEMWPPADEGRVKSLIRERRGRGILANLACDCRPAMVSQPTRPKRKPSPPDETLDPRVKSIIDD
jgi:hypothetical protein